MGTRQAEKTWTTRTALKTAAKNLFLEQGYENTSIQEIASKAGYSVGSVYRQWKSKADLFIEIWDEYSSDFIQTSVNQAPVHPDQDTMIDYLMARAVDYRSNEMTIKLYRTSEQILASYEYEGLIDWLEKHRQMIYRFLKEQNPEKSDDILISAASMIHCLLEADATRNARLSSPKYTFDPQALRLALSAIIEKLTES